MIEKRKGGFTWCLMVLNLFLMFGAACKVKANYSATIYPDGSSSHYSFNGKVGSIYNFIFGSDSLGKYGLESTPFNFALFLGFMAVLVTIVLGILYLSKGNIKLKLSETIASGVATFFLSPIFSHTAVMNFYNGLDSSKKYGTYGEYRGFKYGGMWIFLFIILVFILIYNIIVTCQLKKENFGSNVANKQYNNTSELILPKKFLDGYKQITIKITSTGFVVKEFDSFSTQLNFRFENIKDITVNKYGDFTSFVIETLMPIEVYFDSVKANYTSRTHTIQLVKNDNIELYNKTVEKVENVLVDTFKKYKEENVVENKMDKCDFLVKFEDKHKISFFDYKATRIKNIINMWSYDDRTIYYFGIDLEKNRFVIFPAWNYNDGNKALKTLTPEQKILVLSFGEDFENAILSANFEKFEKMFYSLDKLERIVFKEQVLKSSIPRKISGLDMAIKAEIFGTAYAVADAVDKANNPIVSNTDISKYLFLFANGVLNETVQMGKDTFNSYLKDPAIGKLFHQLLNKKETVKVTTVSSPLDEIKKLKELLDIGAITQEEYDKKKKELLDK